MQLDGYIDIRMEMLITNAFGHPSHFMVMFAQGVYSDRYLELFVCKWATY